MGYNGYKAIPAGLTFTRAKSPEVTWDDQCEDCGLRARWRDGARCTKCNGIVRPGEWLQMKEDSGWPKAKFLSPTGHLVLSEGGFDEDVRTKKFRIHRGKEISRSKRK